MKMHQISRSTATGLATALALSLALVTAAAGGTSSGTGTSPGDIGANTGAGTGASGSDMSNIDSATPSPPDAGAKLEKCMQEWDAATHMSKGEWRTTCLRALNDGPLPVR
jgi:hypothetical protein